jgi:hypothetical protein
LPIALAVRQQVRRDVPVGFGVREAVGRSVSIGFAVRNWVSNDLPLGFSVTSGIIAGAIWPDPAQVAIGVKYGPTGTEYTGTGTFGGGNSYTLQQIAQAVWAHQSALNIPAFLGLR